MSAVDLAAVDPVPPDASMSPIAARFPAKRDRVLPIFIVASLIVHVTAILPSLFRENEKAAALPKEIPIEIVQLPPKPAPAPKAAPKPPQPQPQQHAEQKPAPKPPAPKPQPKPAPKADSVAERMQKLLGAMPAIALPGTSPVGGDEVSYEQLVLSKVAKAKKDGRFAHPPGATGVAFTVGDAGEIVKVKILRSSGDKWLDDEAVDMVKRGAPYPPPPPGARRDFAITLRLQSLI